MRNMKGNAKLSDDDVSKIRRLAGEGFSNRIIADQYKVDQNTIRRIVKWESRVFTYEEERDMRNKSYAEKVKALKERLD